MRRIIPLIEHYVNKVFKDEFEVFYGKDSSIKITKVAYATTKKSIYIECVVILRGELHDDIMDNTLITVLLSDSIKFFNINESVLFNISFDV